MIHYALESVFLISSLIRVLLAYIWLQSSTLGGKILSDESILSLLQDAPSVSTMKLCRFSVVLYKLERGASQKSRVQILVPGSQM